MGIRKKKDKKRRNPFLSLSFRLVAAIFCLFLMLSYVSVLIDPAAFPLAGFFGLYFIPVLTVNVLLLIAALLRWSSSAWIPAIAILPSLFFAGCFFQPGDRSASMATADSPSVKIMTWNVGGFRSGTERDAGRCLQDIAAIIKAENPDIVSLQEYRTGDAQSLRSTFPQYPYIRHNFYRLRNGDYVGNLILSRLPVTGEGCIEFKASTNMVLYTDISISGEQFRLFNVHLESNNISLTSVIKKIRGGYDEFSHELAQAHEKVKKSSTRRGSQVRALLDNISESGLPAVICGDVNDTPMSYCYRKLKKGRIDTFREAGMGFGATYRLLWPLLRIDYVFVPGHTEVLGHRSLRVGCSDHYPVIVTISDIEK
ncbi:MAG TPA: endonuclease/exonuclease/phosphatase family protein [Candidatus Coprenecus pullistercoris]|nr:endonuclease/exonuclease/phosphatase family protein [Candidatus Coprenecus pullistercoris]